MKNRIGKKAALLAGMLMAGGCVITSAFAVLSGQAEVKTEGLIRELVSGIPVMAAEDETAAGGNKFVKQEVTIPEVTFEQKEIPDTGAMQFVENMKLGWCLGNTFDASTDENLDGDELKYETLWCGAETTPELIQSIKDAGFETIRIPVSWHNHVDEEFTISDAWMDRVQEVVDYAVDADLHIIINIHHDNDPRFFYPDSEHLESSLNYVTTIWEQIAERFAEYDEKLIFEALNEPRLVGTQYEWWLNPNAAECKEAVSCLNQLTQAFVDTVRSSGGNNGERYLMIPGYCASVDGAMNDGFQLPKDSVEDRLIVSVHAYTPYNFALQKPSEQGSVSTFDMESRSSTKDIDYLMNSLYEKWTSQGVPVVIGEFGAMFKDQNQQARVDWASYYVAQARSVGITCCWWDNNAFTGDGENFGLISRFLRKWRFQDVVDAMMLYSAVPENEAKETSEAVENK
ncbi:MAG: glycoside hydrolase family 5 protein [Lachnospiraceae bacterium]|nr:glycoside hydrolase family 5 protein [Lachnospiraceae bacterium]